MQSTLLITLFFSAAIAQQPDSAPTKNPPEPWEITRFYGKDWLRSHFITHETLPDRITIPYVEGKVIDQDGNAIAGAIIASHTPRHWVDLHKVVNEEKFHGPVTKSKEDGSFVLPERTEPYRILVQHDAGVASLSHEDLLYADGEVVLQPWATVEGTLKLRGQPVAGATILLRPNFRSWSYRTGGPRVTGDFETTTDQKGRFRFERVPPIPGRIFELQDRRLNRGTLYECRPGETTQVPLGRGASVYGKLKLPPGEEITRETRIFVRHVLPPVPYPDELKDDRNARSEWYFKWAGTDEGIEVEEDRNFLMNSHYTAYPHADGDFDLTGLQPGDYKVLVYHQFSDKDKSTAHELTQLHVENVDQEFSLGGLESTLPESKPE